jgi:hypothetical protein
MGYDAGFLTSEHAPVLHYRKGDPDWNDDWLADTDPQKWIRDSVVWYSQRVTAALGPARFQRYATAFHYRQRGRLGRSEAARRPEVGVDRFVAAGLAARGAGLPRTRRATRTAGQADRLRDDEPHHDDRRRSRRLGDPRQDGHRLSAAGRRPQRPRARLRLVRRLGAEGRAHVRVRAPDAGQSLQDGPAGLRARDAFLPGLPATLDAL